MRAVNSRIRPQLDFKHALALLITPMSHSTFYFLTLSTKFSGKKFLGSAAWFQNSGINYFSVQDLPNAAGKHAYAYIVHIVPIEQNINHIVLPSMRNCVEQPLAGF